MGPRGRLGHSVGFPGPGPRLPVPWMALGTQKANKQRSCVHFKPHYKHIKNKSILALSLGAEAGPRTQLSLALPAFSGRGDRTPEAGSWAAASCALGTCCQLPSSLPQSLGRGHSQGGPEGQGRVR